MKLTRMANLLGPLALLVAAISLSFSTPPTAGCSGCIPSGGSGAVTAYGANGTDFVKISLSTTAGLCLQNMETGLCVGVACQGSVTRSWQLPVGTVMSHCTKTGTDPRECVDPAPIALTATGSTTSSKALACGGQQTTFTVGAPGIGPASLIANCTKCE